MAWERIDTASWQEQRGHVERYTIAASLLRDNETVIDAACGIGYGASVIAKHARVKYHGVDRANALDPQFLQHGWFSDQDLNAWSPGFDFDVALCFETLEHLADPMHMVGWLKLAKRLIMVSVPTIPTKHLNEYHLHDFTVDQVLEMFDGVGDIQVTAQPAEYSHIFTIRI